MLAGADVLAAFLATISIMFLGQGQAAQLVWSLAFLPLWILVAKLLGLYDRDERALRHLTVDEIPSLVLWALIGTTGLSLFLELTPGGRPSSSSALAVGGTAAVSVFLLRGAARWLWRATTPPERVAIVGSDGAADGFARKLELFPDVHATIVARHDPGEVDEIRRDPVVLRALDRILYAPESFEDRHLRAVLEIARATGVKLSVVPPYPRAFGTAVRLNHLIELPVLEYNTGDLSRSTLFLKRVLDIVVSGVAVVVLSPFFLAVALAVKADSRGPVIFSQWRAGQNGRGFRMHKFRTMVRNAEELLPQLVRLDELAEPVFKLERDPRATRVGRWLRRWSVDELPQLVNVLRGDMSLVGPRPEQVEFVDRYSSEQRLRLAVKPGLTGPMQVYGRGALGLEERLAVENDYIENLSLGRDLRILGMTLSAVFRGKGAF
jgi:exopolysaccharide biosynthesis polyprenyl glycosylphosphotransferase